MSYEDERDIAAASDDIFYHGGENSNCFRLGADWARDYHLKTIDDAKIKHAKEIEKLVRDVKRKLMQMKLKHATELMAIESQGDR